MKSMSTNWIVKCHKWSQNQDNVDIKIDTCETGSRCGHSRGTGHNSQFAFRNGALARDSLRDFK